MKTGKTKNRIREGNPAVTVLLYVLVIMICIATAVLCIDSFHQRAGICGKNECLSGPERVFAGRV